MQLGLETVVAALALGAASGLASQDGVQFSERRAELIDALEKRLDSVASLRVVTRTPEPTEGGETGGYIRSELLFLGPDRLRLDFAHGSNERPWQGRYWRHRTFIKGDSYLVSWPGKLAFERRKFVAKELPLRFAKQSWLRASGFWPRRARIPAPKVYGLPMTLLDAARDPRYSLADDAKRADTGGCVVLELAGRDSIDLDRSKGWAITRRRWWNSRGKLLMQMDVTAFTEIAGWHLPTEYRIRNWTAPGPPTKDYMTTAETTELNSMRPEQFDYEPPPGTLRIDRSKGGHSRQEVRGGLGYLVGIGDQFADRYGTQREGGWFWWVVVFLALPGLGVAFPAARSPRLSPVSEP